MAHLTGAEARELGRKIVMAHPGGIGVADINRIIGERHPEMVGDDGKLSGTVRGATWDLEKKCPDVVKLADGRRAPKGTSPGAPEPSDAPKEKRAASEQQKATKAPEKPKEKRQTFAQRSAGKRLDGAADLAAMPRDAEIRALFSRFCAVAHEAGDDIAEQEADNGQNIRLALTRATECYDARKKLKSAAAEAGALRDAAESLRAQVDALNADRSKMPNGDGERLRAAMKAACLDCAALARKLEFSHRAAVADVLRERGPRPLQGKLLAWVEKQERAQPKDPA